MAPIIILSLVRSKMRKYKLRTVGQEELVTSGANDVLGLVDVSVEVLDGVDDVGHQLELRCVQVIHHIFFQL